MLDVLEACNLVLHETNVVDTIEKSVQTLFLFNGLFRDSNDTARINKEVVAACRQAAAAPKPNCSRRLLLVGCPYVLTAQNRPLVRAERFQFLRESCRSAYYVGPNATKDVECA